MQVFSIDNDHTIFTMGSIYKKKKKNTKRKQKYKHTFTQRQCTKKYNSSNIFMIIMRMFTFYHKSIDLGVLYCILKIHIASGLKQKFYFIKKIMHNVFFNTSMRNTFFEYLCTYQKTCMQINKIKQYRKNKLNKRFQNEMTLRLIPFSEIPTLHKIKIIQNKTIYEFSVKELLILCHNSLSYSEYLISIPSLPKNPYTNIEFTITNMYNLYIKSKCACINIPTLFESFIHHRMDFDLFFEYNSNQLNWISCIQYVDKLEDLSKLNYINQLLISYSRYKIRGNLSQNEIDSLICRSKKMLCCDVFIVNFEPTTEIFQEKRKIIQRCIHDLVSNYKSYIHVYN